MKQRLSILIPCFNVEKYIRQCLDSIYCMSLLPEEFEVLCFDDMSTDNTPIILEEYARKFKNLCVFCAKTKNGPGGGRNSLFAKSKGQYVWFVDGDDMIEPKVAEQLLIKAEMNKVDVLVFNYKEWDANGNEINQRYSLPDSIVKCGAELCNEIFDGGLVNNMGYPVRLLLRREYLVTNGILFPENMRYGEDTVWMARVCLYAEKMKSISDYGYIYWHHEESTCGMLRNSYPGRTIYEKCIKTSIQLKDFVEELRNYGQSEYSELLKSYANEIGRFISSHYVNCLPIMLSRSTLKERREFYRYMSSCGRINEINQYANRLTSILCMPVFGQIMSEFLAVIYKLKHGYK